MGSGGVDCATASINIFHAVVLATLRNSLLAKSFDSWAIWTMECKSGKTSSRPKLREYQSSVLSFLV